MNRPNSIIELIEKKMENDNWLADSPDSYCSYLFQLTDEDIIEYFVKKVN